MGYIHPADSQIAGFRTRICKGKRDLETICRNALTWFDDNIAYSRLEAPFFPLQRSDLDVLAMHAGTCGDYTNLLVSVLLANGFDAQYAYVHRDCYGDAQDHICAAVKEHGRTVLIDATQPYRKWHGFDCPHREVELLSPDAFERRMKSEEAYWTAAAEKQGRPLLAGLLYAPWVYAECVFASETVFDQVFYLLTVNDPLAPVLSVYDLHYTPQESAAPIMAEISCGNTLFHFSVHPRTDLWDPQQWSPGLSEADLPMECRSDEWQRMQRSISNILPRIDRILHQAGCGSLRLS